MIKWIYRTQYTQLVKWDSHWANLDFSKHFTQLVVTEAEEDVHVGDRHHGGKALTQSLQVQIPFTDGVQLYAITTAEIVNNNTGKMNKQMCQDKLEDFSEFFLLFGNYKWIENIFLLLAVEIRSWWRFMLVTFCDWWCCVAGDFSWDDIL